MYRKAVVSMLKDQGKIMLQYFSICRMRLLETEV